MRFVLKNVRLFAGAADFTTRSNRVEVNMEAESKDTTAFAPTGDVWHEEIPGIKSTSVTGAGQWESGPDASFVDPEGYERLGSVGPLTIAPQTAVDGAKAYLTAFNRTGYTLGGSVGDVIPWSGNWVGAWAMARGVILHAPAQRTATGAGSVLQLPAVPAGRFLVGTLHTLGVAGTTPSLTGVIESAATVGFASPTTRLTFNAQTAIGGQVFRIAGPITDTYYRFSYTITGTTPNFLIMSAAGVSA